MKQSRLFLYNAIMLIMAATSFSCSEIVGPIQNFTENQGPSIISFTDDLADGTELVPNMPVILTVEASDPEGKALHFVYSSEDGSFTNQQDTLYGSTVEFRTAGYLVSSVPVSVGIRVSDDRGGSVYQSIILGMTRAGPTITTVGDIPNYVRSNGQRTYSFTANESGLYQVQMLGDTGTTSMFDELQASYFYGAGDTVSITIDGPSWSGTAGHVPLTSSPPDKLAVVIIDALQCVGRSEFIMNIDDDNPASSVVPADGSKFPYSTQVTVTAADVKSGPARIAYTVQGPGSPAGADPDFSGNGTVVEGGTAVTTVGGSTVGTYTIKYRAMDKAGNIETVQSASYEIGTTKVVVYQDGTAVSNGGSFDFGAVHDDNNGNIISSKVFTFTNEGTQPVTVSSINVTGVNSGEFVVSLPALPRTIASEETISCAVVFDPESEDSKTATISIISNDPVDGSYQFSLTGQGTRTLYDETDVGTITETSLTVAGSTIYVNYIVMWGTNAGIHFAQSVNSGNTWSNTNILAGGGIQKTSSSFVENSIMVTYEATGTDTSTNNYIFSLQSDDAGNSWGTSYIVGGYNDFNHSNISRVTGSGDFFVVWLKQYDADENHDAGVYINYKNSGDSWYSALGRQIRQFTTDPSLSDRVSAASCRMNDINYNFVSYHHPDNHSLYLAQSNSFTSWNSHLVVKSGTESNQMGEHSSMTAKKEMSSMETEVVCAGIAYSFGSSKSLNFYKYSPYATDRIDIIVDTDEGTGTDPSIMSSDTGFYIGYYNPVDNKVYIASSTDGTSWVKNYTGISNVSSVKMAIDPADSRNIYCVYVDGTKVKCAISRDGGLTW